MYITSILDNDLYKFSMGQAVNVLYPGEVVRFEFFNRGKTQFPQGFEQALRTELRMMKLLSLKDEEAEFLEKKCPYLTPVYINFLKGYRYEPENEITITQNGGDLSIIISGFWHRVIYWEVPIMALVSELYFKLTGQTQITNSVDVAMKKAARLLELKANYADFGTRRRYSFKNHLRVAETLATHGKPYFVGSSNVYISMLLDMAPKGTQAHEWTQFHAARYGFPMANEMALKKWVEVYQGDLGIALPDTYTTEVFLRSFNSLYAKLFDGVRQDSGDPYVFTDKVIEHYKKLRINPQHKTIIYSDGLDLNMVEAIQNYRRDEISRSYGIGTFLTNDVGLKPLNIVIKMTGWWNGSGWVPVVKYSDNPGKHTGCPETISLCKKILHIPA